MGPIPPHLNEKYAFLLQINIMIMNIIERYYVTKLLKVNCKYIT